jgi:hypothetical protein
MVRDKSIPPLWLSAAPSVSNFVIALGGFPALFEAAAGAHARMALNYMGI